MNFIKSNILFIIVMVITLIGSGYLIFRNLEKHFAIVEINEETQKSQQDLDKAIKNPIKPVELNITKLSEDTARLQNLVIDLQRMFGNPYRKALIHFAENMKMTETEIKTMFREVFNKSEKEDKIAEKLVLKFFAELMKTKNIDKKSLDKAFKQFIDDVQNETIETLTINSGYEFFAMAMGLERVKNPTKAQSDLGTLQSYMNQQHMIPGAENINDVYKFTFSQFTERIPSGSEIPDILITMPMFEDIFRRMKLAGISRVISFTKDPKPVVNGSYKFYKFHSTFESKLDAVRKFTELLQNAYVDNRIYIITWVSIKSDASKKEIDELRTKMQADQNTSISSEQMEPDMRTTERPKRRKKKVVNDQKSNEFEDMILDKPGKVWISGNKLVEVKMDFKYCIFTGEDLKIN